MIKAVSGYGRTEGQRLDERRPLTRLGDKKESPVRLTPAQAAQLKTQPDTPQGRRDALLFCLLLELGLRVGEIHGLRAADLDLEQGELRFYRPKVSLEQTHELPEETWYAARRYLRLEGAMVEKVGGGLLLASRKNGALLLRPCASAPSSTASPTWGRSFWA